MNLFAMSRDARRPGPDINLPDWLTFLRIAQGMLALLILIFSGVAAGKYLLGSDPTYLVSPSLLQVIDRGRRRGGLNMRSPRTEH